jgi:hypothetical protein
MRFTLEAGGGQGTVAVVHIHYSLVALLDGAFLIVCVKLGAYLQSDMITRIPENYQHSFHKIHAFYQHFARPENDQSLFALCTKTHPRLSPPPPTTQRHSRVRSSSVFPMYECYWH